jgi:hypothetical protein
MVRHGWGPPTTWRCLEFFSDMGFFSYQWDSNWRGFHQLFFPCHLWPEAPGPKKAAVTRWRRRLKEL